MKKGDYTAMSTNQWIYKILKVDGEFPEHGGCTDVEDAARAHVLALTAPPTSEVGRKRILLSSEWYLYSDVAKFIAEKRPELKGRLLDGSKSKPGVLTGEVVDHSKAKSILGLDERDWHETILDAVDAVLETEKQWA